MNGKTIIGIVVGIVAFAAYYSSSSNGIRGLFGGSIEKKIERTAAELNKTLPKQVDEVTRWDRVEPGPGKAFTYIYTVSMDLTPEQWKQAQTEITQQVLTMNDMKELFDAGVVVWYKFCNQSGAKVYEFSVRR